MTTIHEILPQILWIFERNLLLAISLSTPSIKSSKQPFLPMSNPKFLQSTSFTKNLASTPSENPSLSYIRTSSHPISNYSLNNQFSKSCQMKIQRILLQRHKRISLFKDCDWWKYKFALNTIKNERKKIIAWLICFLSKYLPR